MNHSSNKAILTLLEAYPRANLIQAATIIHRLPRISSCLGQNVFVLRDDLTGFALGGNKTRKVDYLFGDAIAKKACTLVSRKASSFSRNAAVAASACGLDFHLVLAGKQSQQNSASQAIFKQCGTQLHYAGHGEHLLQTRYEDLVDLLRAQGKTVYELHPGGSDSIGALAYVHTFAEIIEFTQLSGIHFSHILHSTSSAGTQAGLVLGQCISGYGTQVVGINAALEAKQQYDRVHSLACSTADLLGVEIDASLIRVDDRFIGPGYALPSEQGRHAVKLFTALEGLLLDQVYSGKAAGALLHLISKGALGRGNVLFVHTGGNAGLFY